MSKVWQWLREFVVSVYFSWCLFGDDGFALVVKYNFGCSIFG
jgi:hypothetical protein